MSRCTVEIFLFRRVHKRTRRDLEIAMTAFHCQTPPSSLHSLCPAPPSGIPSASRFLRSSLSLLLRVPVALSQLKFFFVLFFFFHFHASHFSHTTGNYRTPAIYHLSTFLYAYIVGGSRIGVFYVGTRIRPLLRTSMQPLCMAAAGLRSKDVYIVSAPDCVPVAENGDAGQGRGRRRTWVRWLRVTAHMLLYAPGYVRIRIRILGVSRDSSDSLVAWNCTTKWCDRWLDSKCNLEVTGN